MTLAPGLGLSLAPYPRFYRLGLEPLSEAPLCALQPPAPSFLVVLVAAACLRKLLVLSIELPSLWMRLPGLLRCTSSCQQVVFCAWRILLLVRPRPLSDDSLGALGLPARLLWPSLQPRVCKSSHLSSWSFPFRGLTPFSCLFLGWRPCQSCSLIPSLAPSWWCPCPLMRWALLTLSDFVLSVPSAFLCVGLVGRSRRIVAPLMQCLCWRFSSFVSGSSCRGASPHTLGSAGAHGVSGGSTYIAFHRTWSVSSFCRAPMELRSVFHTFPERRSASIHGDYFNNT